jgi:SAM-dependent methyltransferase
MTQPQKPDGLDGNTAQAEGWNGEEGLYWVEHRERHERMQRHFTPRLLAAADIAPNSNVLDVGCGCGGTALAAAEQTARGQVLGVDLSGPMLGEARRRASECGYGGRVRFEQADAQVHPFPVGGFEVALSRFGVMFFADPATAFANLARALRPGGRLAFLSWRPVAENAFLAVPFGALAPYLALPDLGGPDAPGPFSLADPARIRKLLTGAGFTGVDVEAVDAPMRIGRDVDDVLDYQIGLPMARTMLAAIEDQATVDRALAALREALQPHQRPDGLELGGAAWLVTARRAT